jgi:hypothetical protein
LLDVLSSLLDGKVGAPYAVERLEEIYKIGNKRYEHEIPPGYKDKDKDKDNKEGVRKFGDLILWLQIVDKAKDTKKPIILVTDDMKDDWWLRSKGRIIGPRPELVDEIHSSASVKFYLYQADRFMEYAKKFLERQVKQEAIDEVREIRNRDEVIWERQEKMGSIFVPGILQEQYLPGILPVMESALEYRKFIETLGSSLNNPSLIMAEKILQDTIPAYLGAASVFLRAGKESPIIRSSTGTVKALNEDIAEDSEPDETNENDKRK